MKIKRDVLSNMLDRAMKVASNDKLLPMTSLICIKTDKDKLSLETTDGANYFIVSTKDVTVDDDLNFSVSIDTLPKLISRMTCDEVTLTKTETHLQVVGGKGKYKVDIPCDENGDVIKFPDIPEFSSDDEHHYALSRGHIDKVLTANAGALAKNLDVPCYLNYYVVNDSVITTDTIVMCGHKGLLKADKPMLISPALMNVLSVMQSDSVDMSVYGDMIVFSTADAVAYGNMSTGIEDYQIDAIQGLLSQDYPCMCRINKDELTSVLSRIALFIGEYDEDAVKLDFTAESLNISSKATTGIDSISYTEMEDVQPEEHFVSATMLLNQLKAYSAETVTIYFGVENSMKIVDGDTTQIIAYILPQ